MPRDPESLYKTIRLNKRDNVGKIQKLTVRDKVYLGDSVADGFYDSLLDLKSLDHASIDSSRSYNDFSDDYDGILEICSSGEPIPQLTEIKSKEILMKIKPGVNDLYSITASHYINAGEPGFKHFFLLLSALIADIGNITITEINAVYATILFKGQEL